ncbi:MAG TPA: DNA mismatch repair protein MutS [Clostridia bacterium]|nr:DNA mismatch repair protein MutS [Clostridia bacterium]
MKPYLLFEQYKGDLYHKIPNEKDLAEDLNLSAVFRAMAQNDSFIHNTARQVILCSLSDTEAISYRQNVLKDCLNNQSVIRRLYDISENIMEEAAFYKQSTQPSFSRAVTVSYKLRNAAGLADILIAGLETLRSTAHRYKGNFKSKGLTAFCLQQETLLTDDFFIELKKYISDLGFISEGGRIIIGSSIGKGLKGTAHILRSISNRNADNKGSKEANRSRQSGTILLDNISIANNAKEVEEAGLVHILRLLNRFNESVLDFFDTLHFEAGFYAGCINLHNIVKGHSAAVSFPVPDEANKRNLSFESLYDLSLLLNEQRQPVSNGLDTHDTCLYIITGANQGGKSTYLRSIGIAQLLMQCGMFVPASYYRANVSESIFTYFTREEDESMNSGKLEEELKRMNEIISSACRNSLIFMNEPFATTTERDGSKIAQDIVTAFYELDVKTLVVTHLFEFANLMFVQELQKAVFLRAERSDGGSRTFNIKEGEPLTTSYGEDIFNSVMG